MTPHPGGQECNAFCHPHDGHAVIGCSPEPLGRAEPGVQAQFMGNGAIGWIYVTREQDAPEAPRPEMSAHVHAPGTCRPVVTWVRGSGFYRTPGEALAAATLWWSEGRA